MEQKTKKQHYIPQFYLNSWCFSKKKQVYVYDKLSDIVRISNIQDVASERYFYDASPNDVFSAEILDCFRQLGLLWDRGESSQGIEHGLSEEIEKPFSDLLKSIFGNVSEVTPWHIKNCYFINEEVKLDFSTYLTFQLIRTKYYRNRLSDSSNCLVQSLRDMGFPEESIKKYQLSKDDVKNNHIRAFFDIKNLTEITHCFFRLTWILGINRTKSKFFTSDNPINTIPHIHDPILSMNGLASFGVEVIFPLSPDLILIMIDGAYHTNWGSYESRYVEITEVEIVNYYNAILARHADRFVYSSNDNMTLIERIKKNDPSFLANIHTALKLGEKIYYPQKQSSNDLL